MADTILSDSWDRKRGRLCPRLVSLLVGRGARDAGEARRCATLRVLRALGVEAGNKVVEVGPGTGYEIWKARELRQAPSA